MYQTPMFRNFAFKGSENFSRDMRDSISSFRGLGKYFALNSNPLPVQSRAYSATCLYIRRLKEGYLRAWMVFARGGSNTSLAIPATPCAREGARYHRRYGFFRKNRSPPFPSIIQAQW